MKRKSFIPIALAIMSLLCTKLSGQIVADHSVVQLYDDIPQQWIDSVKTKLTWIIGMSHGNAYFRGAELLELLDTSYQVDIWYHEDAPGDQSDALRLGRPRWGRESFWTSQDGIDNFNESSVADQNETGNEYDHIMFGWSYQSVWENDLGGLMDTVYNVHWAGSTQGGLDGNKRWGLDSGDSILTENRVCMDNYLDAVEQFNQFYKDSAYVTKFLFSNGIVDDDGGTEMGFQRELKNQYVRDYVELQGDTVFFFDYADILVYSDSGDLYTEDWLDGDSIRPHQQIHPDNEMDYDENFNIISPGDDEYEDHIGEVGALRLAKALWWLLARNSGWDGSIPVRDVQISSEGDSTKVMTGSYLQFYGSVIPEDADNPALTWSVINGTGTATISSTGLLKGGFPGYVDVVASSLDGSGVADTMLMTIAPPLLPVVDISISTNGGGTEILAGAWLQCTASVLPIDASNSGIRWSVINHTGMAAVSEDGLVSGLNEGVVEVIASSEDGSMVADTLKLTISGSVILVSQITISSDGGVSQLISGEELQYSATVLPIDASNPAVSWGVIHGTGSASISSGGLLSAEGPGEVWVYAIANDISGEGDTLDLTISQPEVPVSGITVSTAGGITEVEGGTNLQCSATVLPVNATNSAVAWSVLNGTGTASINQNGLLSAVKEGTVLVRASAQDGSGVSSNFALTIKLATGLSEQEKSDPIVLYPNPSSGKFYLDAGTLSLNKVKIYSLVGTLVHELVPNPGIQIFEMDLSDLNPGIYFVQLSYKKELQVNRLIISR